MPSTAGRFAAVKIGGTPTAFTDEAVTVLTTNKKYQITSTTKRVWSPTATITVKAAGVEVDAEADPYAINRLTGVVEFTNTTARGTVTVSGTYLPMSTIAKSKSVTYDLMNQVLDDTTFDSAGWSETIPGINSARATLGRNWESTYGPILRAHLVAGDLIVLQIFSKATTAADLLMWCYPTKATQDAAVSSIITDALEFVGASDADGRVVSIA